MRKSWQINQEILALLTDGDRRITHIVYGCNLNSRGAYTHLEMLVKQAAVVYVEETLSWRITRVGREMLRELGAGV